MEPHSRQFTFTPIPKKSFDPLNEKETSKLLEKWGLKHRIDIQAFAIDQQFHPYQKQILLDEFFSDPCVLREIKVVDDSNSWSCLGKRPTKIVSEFVPCSQTTMDLFKRLENGDILRPGGNVLGCYEECVDGMQVSDELRKLMLATVDERVESDHRDLYTAAEQDEFIFRLFRHLSIGGNLCQYEDNVEPYLTVAKQIYKDLVSVVKDPAENQLVVTSSVFKVNLYDEDAIFFPGHSDKSAHPQTFAYVIVSPQKKRIFSLYHKFLESSMW